MSQDERGVVSPCVNVNDGEVQIDFGTLVQQVALTPQMALEFGEGVARAAYNARFGTQTPLKGPGKSAITAAVRDRLINRVLLITRSMREQNRSDVYIATHVVDTVLSAAN